MSSCTSLIESFSPPVAIRMPVVPSPRAKPTIATAAQLEAGLWPIQRRLPPENMPLK